MPIRPPVSFESSNGSCLQRSPRPPSWIWGPTSKEREGEGGEERGGDERGREEREGEEREGKGRKGRGGEGKGHEPPTIWRKFSPMVILIVTDGRTDRRTHRLQLRRALVTKAVLAESNKHTAISLTCVDIGSCASSVCGRHATAAVYSDQCDLAHQNHIACQETSEPFRLQRRL